MCAAAEATWKRCSKPGPLLLSADHMGDMYGCWPVLALLLVRICAFRSRTTGLLFVKLSLCLLAVKDKKDQPPDGVNTPAMVPDWHSNCPRPTAEMQRCLLIACSAPQKEPSPPLSVETNEHWYLSAVLNPLQDYGKIWPVFRLVLPTLGHNAVTGRAEWETLINSRSCWYRTATCCSLETTSTHHHSDFNKYKCSAFPRVNSWGDGNHGNVATSGVTSTAHQRNNPSTWNPLGNSLETGKATGNGDQFSLPVKNLIY